MITMDVHCVDKISARAVSSDCGKYSWVKLTLCGPKELVEVTAFMPEAAAQAYAAAINSVDPRMGCQATVEPVEQKAAA